MQVALTLRQLPITLPITAKSLRCQLHPIAPRFLGAIQRSVSHRDQLIAVLARYEIGDAERGCDVRQGLAHVGKNDRLAALSVEEPEDEDERSQNVLFSMNGDGDGGGK